ncbi:MAG TPA: hypothetical protein VFR15_13645 [Chloroflexia bacterium]|nr:hypothetical protein [Chloroflexia bacterium]
MRATLRKSGAALALAALVSISAIAPGASAQTQPDPPPYGAVSAMAIDNVGGGWAWTGPRDQNDLGHILRLQNGAWGEVVRDSREAGALGRAAAVYDFELSGDGRQGWAIGSGGGQRIFQLRDGNWINADNPFPPDWTLNSLTVNANGTDGWLVAQDTSVRQQLARLRNGRWVREVHPVFAEVRHIAISPDGLTVWAIGESRNNPQQHVAVRMQDGVWVDDPQQMYEVPFNAGPVVVDNLGNGWTLGPPINSVLVRLTPDGAEQVLPDLESERPDMYPGLVLQSVAVNSRGRGWLTATYKKAEGRIGAAEANVAVLFRLDGDRYTEVPFGAVPVTAGTEMPPYAGPIAISPDGAHSWVAVSSGESKFMNITELREPWPHDQPPAAAPLPGAGLCFEDVPHCLRGPFARFWQANGGLDVLGYPITPEVTQRLGDVEYVVQYTQRARLEYHPENAGKPSEVLLGLLGNSLVESRLNEDPFKPVPASAAPATQWFPETQHNVGPPILPYWQRSGGLAVFGLPRSEAFDEVNQADGKRYLVQYFERNRIEHHPENAGTKYEFLLGLLGVEQFKATLGYTP